MSFQTFGQIFVGIFLLSDKIFVGQNFSTDNRNGKLCCDHYGCPKSGKPGKVRE